jgi:hypothetical protein
MLCLNWRSIPSCSSCRLACNHTCSADTIALHIDIEHSILRQAVSPGQAFQMHVLNDLVCLLCSCARYRIDNQDSMQHWHTKISSSRYFGLPEDTSSLADAHTKLIYVFLQQSVPNKRIGHPPKHIFAKNWILPLAASGQDCDGGCPAAPAGRRLHICCGPRLWLFLQPGPCCWGPSAGPWQRQPPRGRTHTSTSSPFPVCETKMHRLSLK